MGVSRCVSVYEGGWGIVCDAAASSRSGSIAESTLTLELDKEKVNLSS